MKLCIFDINNTVVYIAYHYIHNMQCFHPSTHLSIKYNSVYAAWAFKESCLSYSNTQCSLPRDCLGRVLIFPTVIKAMRTVGCIRREPAQNFKQIPTLNNFFFVNLYFKTPVEVWLVEPLWLSC